MHSCAIVLALWTVVVEGQQWVQWCNTAIPESTPIASFRLDAEGTATDLQTGLTWKRCAEGQIWDGTTCMGTAITGKWEAALRRGVASNSAGHVDWRLPNAKELMSIVEERCLTPAINATVFPNTPIFVWSGSPSAQNPGYAWFVDAYYGLIDGDRKSSNFFAVRLVRGGQAVNVAAADVPTLSQWALRLMVALVLAACVFHYKRR